MPLKAPSVDAILVALDVEPEVEVPEGVLPEEVVVAEDVAEYVVLDGKGLISYIHMLDSLQHCTLTCSCAVRSTVPQPQSRQ